MKTSDLINEVTKEVQCRLDEIFAAVGTPDPNSTLDQVGLIDGDETVRDYLHHGEEGLAFDHLLYMISEPDIELTITSYEQLTRAGKLLGVSPEAWSTVRHASVS